MTPTSTTMAQGPSQAGVRAVEAQSRQRGSATDGAPQLDFAGIVDGAAADVAAPAVALKAVLQAPEGEVPALPVPVPAATLDDQLVAALAPRQTAAPAPADSAGEAAIMPDDAGALLAMLDPTTPDDLPAGDPSVQTTAPDIAAAPTAVPSTNAFAGLAQALTALTQQTGLPQQQADGGQGLNDPALPAVPVPPSAGGPTNDAAPPIAVPNTSPVFAASRPRAIPSGPVDVPPADVSWTVGRRETHFAPASVRATADRLALLPGGGPPTSPPAAVDTSALSTILPGGTTPALAVQSAYGDEIAPVLAAVTGSAQQADDGAGGGPNPMGHPAHQVFERLVGQLSQAPSSAPAAAPASPVVPLRDPSQFQPLRSLDIALEPQGLGTLTLKLAVKNDMLRIEVVAANRDTAGLLERDRDMLSSLVKSAGYQVDHLAIRHVDGDRGLVAQALQPAADPSTVRPSGQAGGTTDMSFDGRSGSGQSQGDRPQGGARQSWRDAADVIPATPATKPRSVAAGIYI